MTTNNQKPSYRIYLQYVLIGGAIGLYYGIFFREPQTPPDFLMAFLLSFLAALVTVIIRSWKKGRSFNEILVDFAKIFAIFAVFMVGLELRKVIFELWGKTSVIVFTTSLGVLIGLIVAIRRKDDQTGEKTTKKKD